MGRAHARAEIRIDATPGAVYQVLADYSTHHPRVMPPKLFENLVVESGGMGADTVFHITLKLAGRKKRLHVRVGEPEPGRVLTETDLDTDVVTEFTVDALNGGSSTRAGMFSEWQTGSGLRGLSDRTVLPRLTRWIFGKELRQLETYMRSDEAPK